jgi:hypothetical protein
MFSEQVIVYCCLLVTPLPHARAASCETLPTVHTCTHMQCTCTDMLACTCVCAHKCAQAKSIDSASHEDTLDCCVMNYTFQYCFDMGSFSSVSGI